MGHLLGGSCGLSSDLVVKLGAACDKGSVDDFRDAWSKGVESGLLQAFCSSGGPAAPGMDAFLGRGRLRVRRRRLGGRAVGGTDAGRVYSVSHGDEVDAAAAQFFVLFSLAPVLLFRRRFKSVADAVKGILQQGFSPGTLKALHRCWGAVCRHGPCGLVLTLDPWDSWLPPRLSRLL